ncbi:MAG: Precorrin-2 C(20)-methyltransferase [Hyphomicrobiaceae bacterium hypho_1]
MIDNRLNPQFYIIGVGPGDPELLTIKAVRIISSVDVITYPSTSQEKSRSRQIISKYITEHHKELAYNLPMEIDPSKAQAAYDQVSKEIITRLKEGYSVALLCEGDPFFYGSAIHLYLRIAGKFTTQVIPGITSLTASPAAAGLPMATRNEIVKILPATLDISKLETELETCEAAVIIKVGRHLEKVVHAIRNKRLREYALLVLNVSDDDQRIISFKELDRVKQHQYQPYFSMILISRHKRAVP